MVFPAGATPVISSVPYTVTYVFRAGFALDTETQIRAVLCFVQTTFLPGMAKAIASGSDIADALDVSGEIDIVEEFDWVNPTVLKDKTTRSRSHAKLFMSTPISLS